APRRAVVADALVAIAGAVLAGSVLAVAVAIALSPLSPLGPVRPVLNLGVHVNGLVLGAGCAVLCVVTLLAALTISYRWAPGRRRTPITAVRRGSSLARAAANAGVPASMVAGLHFALESGRGRSSVPVRSLLVGVTLAVAMIGATLTFGSGLTTLVEHPSLYGWNWDNALSANNNVPPQSVGVLRDSPLVAAYTGVNFSNAQINGLTVPILLVPSSPRVAPPLLAGHQVRNSRQIVLGAATMAELHVRLGDVVIGSYGTKADYPVYVPPSRMTVVGVATLPAVGSSQILHTSMGVGAEIDRAIEPLAFRRVIANSYATLNGPNMVFVRFRPSATPSQRRALLDQAVATGNRAFRAGPRGQGSGDATFWVGVQYPSEILNYRSLGDTPLWLALGFASGVAAAFALTIASSVRRRRRDLALLKTLGFTRRQIGSAVAWQATVSVLIGLVVGIPVGVVAGRWLWELFAQQIYAVPRATVPTLSLVLLGVAALALANVVAFFPSRTAARTRAALALRAE
ncbi:MAG: FtsX-like permease family protein, partial [Acidobacteriota bacterium]|nr:FtsX-like permease family protein [Acidobacteriota bacterium]